MIGASEQNKEASEQASGQRPSARTQKPADFDQKLKRLLLACGANDEAGLARVLGIKGQSLYPYMKKRNIPHSWVIDICERFGVSVDWMLWGTGPMKLQQSLSDMGVPCDAVYAPGDPRAKSAPSQHPLGRKAASHTTQDQSQVMLDDQALDLNPEPSTNPQGFKISDDLHKAARVLESGTAYAIALHLNIQQFDRALDDHTGIQQLQRTVDRQGTTMTAQAETIRSHEQTMQAMQDTMAKESEAMRKEVEDLKAQLARLLSTGGDDPHHSEEVA